MFARTERLTLRPGWIEDAPALARAMAHEAVVRNTSRVPWPYAQSDAEAWLARSTDSAIPSLLIFAHEGASVHLVGGIGVGPFGEEPFELGYWITPDAWGRGYATEAGNAVLAIAGTLRLPRISAGHFVDNPASGAVLRKLGFEATGVTESVHSLGRGASVTAHRFERLLGSEPIERIAA